MKSLTTPDFWQAYAQLPEEIKEQARKAYQLWQENQSHPSLHFKKVGFIKSRQKWTALFTRSSTPHDIFG
jgi:hypothetical protein